MVTNRTKVLLFLFSFTYLSIWGVAMGCVRFARLIDIPVCSETEALEPYMVPSASAYGSTEGKKYTKQYFNLFSSIIKASVSI